MSVRKGRLQPWVALGALAVTAFGCAKGVQDELQDKAGTMASQTPAAADDGMQGVPGDEAPATTDDAGDGQSDADAMPCSQGTAEACACAEGGEGERDCIFDVSSPLDGYYSECRRCSAPMDTSAAGAGADDGGPCSDTMKNGFETGTDCGGPDCGPCPDGQGCITADDCTSGVCGTGFICAAPACDDEVLNGSETDLDCGGDDCDPCPAGGACVVDGDCEGGGPCQDDTCQCAPLTVDDCATDFCGSLDDGCGGQVQCPACEAPAQCISDMCCTPLTVADCGADDCGSKPDGCGGTIDCPDTCADSGLVCNGNTCEAACVPSGCPLCLGTRCCVDASTCGCEVFTIGSCQ